MTDRPSPDQQIRRGVRLIATIGLAGLDPETRRRLVSSVLGHLEEDGGLADLEDGDAELLWGSVMLDHRRRTEAVEKGPGEGWTVRMDGNEVATAIVEWLARNGPGIRGPRTIRLTDPEPGAVTGGARIYVDPSGSVENVTS